MTARQQVMTMARRLAACGLNQGAAGNVSVRHDTGMWVTPSGIHPDCLTMEQIVDMDWNGQWQGRWKPSSEWRFHRDIYQHRPDIHAIIHCHSPYATALAVLGRDIPPFHYMIAMAGGDSIRCAPYALFGTQALSDAALGALQDRLACLLGHHGMIACGRDLDHAFAVAQEVEHLSHLYLSVLPLGEPPCLSQQQMSDVLAAFKTYGSQPLA